MFEYNYYIICASEKARGISNNMRKMMRNVSWFQEQLRYCSRILQDRSNIPMRINHLCSESNINAISDLYLNSMKLHGVVCRMSGMCQKRNYMSFNAGISFFVSYNERIRDG